MEFKTNELEFDSDSNNLPDLVLWILTMKPLNWQASFQEI